jgi:ApbE superfamily uncharacterized protein (UPF0280 family)
VCTVGIGKNSTKDSTTSSKERNDDRTTCRGIAVVASEKLGKRGKTGRIAEN